MNARKPLPAERVNSIIRKWQSLDDTRKEAIKDKIKNAYLASLAFILILEMVLPR